MSSLISHIDGNSTRVSSAGMSMNVLVCCTGHGNSHAPAKAKPEPCSWAKHLLSDEMPALLQPYSSQVWGRGQRHFPSTFVAKNGLSGNRLSRVITPHEPGIQGASPVFASMSMQQLPVRKLQANLTACTPPPIAQDHEISSRAGDSPGTRSDSAVLHGRGGRG